MRGGAKRVPGSHPCDKPCTGPVVYYQALEVVLRGGDEVGDPETDPQFFEKVDRLILKFFFYYDQDIGVGHHTHDLEAIEAHVILDYNAGSCSQIRLDRVEALAHGIRWYTNVLDVQPDTVLPLTILVEEGKHASCPDRNSDGIFTPGYDVNVRVNDAWGVRDVMGAGAVLGTSFSSSMAKTRDAAFRLSPPASDNACSGARGPASLAQSAGLGQYELRPASSVPHCPLTGPVDGRLAGMMDYHAFGEPPDQHSTEVGLVLTGPESLSRIVTGISARLESSKLGIGLTGPGIDLPVFWLVPRFSIVEDSYSAEALITPSASRWAGWYISGGYSTFLKEGIRKHGFAGELGLKLRVTMEGKRKWALLGYSFAGVRFGIRADGFGSLSRPRAIIEFGAGAF